MARSRSGKALRNTLFQLLSEVVTAICGFILPRLILSRFGSSYNGITQSISQFISCIALLKSGIGSVTRAALYKPLAEHDRRGISEVVGATEMFMRRIAMIFGVFVLGFATVYPFIVSEEFSWLFAFTLVLILSISTVAQYFFGMTYQMLIEADQNNYIISIVSIISTIVNTLIASALILAGCTIHVVKLGSAIVFIAPPIFYMMYARKKYHIDMSVPANTSLISQRWDAFAHQLANFINNNTDMIVTTIFLGVREVSVYAIYNMVANNMKKVVNSFTSGTTAAFGNMLARGEYENLKRRFDQFELFIFEVCTVLFVSTAILYLSFIAIYTRGVTDVNYHRGLLAILFCLAEFFACVKLVYENVVFAAGQFKQTKYMAYWEAGINIVLSVILVNFIGLNGILIGTIAAGLFRTIAYNIYSSKNVVHRNPLKIVNRLIYAAVCAGLCWLISTRLPIAAATGFVQWAGWSVVVLVYTFVLCMGLGFVAFKTESVELAKMALRKIDIFRR